MMSSISSHPGFCHCTTISWKSRIAASFGALAKEIALSRCSFDMISETYMRADQQNSFPFVVSRAHLHSLIAGEGAWSFSSNVSWLLMLSTSPLFDERQTVGPVMAFAVLNLAEAVQRLMVMERAITPSASFADEADADGCTVWFWSWARCL